MPYALPPRSAAARTPVLRRPLLTHASAGDPQTLKGGSDSVSYGVIAPLPGSWCTQGFICALQASLAGMKFDFKCDYASPAVLLQLLLCPCTWDICSSGFQHSPVDGCSAASCDFGAFTAEDEHTSFCSAVLFLLLCDRGLE